LKDSKIGARQHGGEGADFIATKVERQGVMLSSCRINYLDNRHALSCLLIFQCENDGDALDLASTMSSIPHKSVEIWRGETIIYEGLNVRVLN
jgi:hypothetical protein